MRAGVGVPVALIGGPARVGKSTLVRRLVAECPSELVHLDHLRSALLSVAGVGEAAALRKAPSIATNTPKEWIAQLRARDAVLWTAAQEYVAAAQDALVLEGGLWPDWVAGLEQWHVAVFVVDTAADMADRLIEIAEREPDSWMARRGWSHDKIRIWAGYNRFRSEHIAEAAERHGYPVFDIAAGISSVQDRALRYLTDAHKGFQQSTQVGVTV